MEEMGSGLPGWLTTVAWLYMATSVVSAGIIAFEIFGRGKRQQPTVMNWVWPLAGLYLGPFGVPVFRAFGRHERADVTAAAVRSGLPGGVSSGLAHVVAVPFVVATGLTIADGPMWAMIAIITVMATAGIFAFEYFVFTARDRRIPGPRGIAPAVVVAVATVVAFDVGMLGWMLLLHFTENMPDVSDIRFTVAMQVGLVLGTLTAFPALRLLAARRLKPVG
jgi:hypothetical protein